MINLQDETQNLAKLTLRKIQFYSTMINTKTCDLLGHLYVFLITRNKRFHSKILSYKKMKNDLKIFIVIL